MRRVPRHPFVARYLVTIQSVAIVATPMPTMSATHRTRTTRFMSPATTMSFARQNQLSFALRMMTSLGLDYAIYGRVIADHVPSICLTPSFQFFKAAGACARPRVLRLLQ